MTKPIARLMCAADVDDEPVVVDGRFPAAYASSSAALLGLFSAEVMRGKRWGSWGMPAAHFPAFRAFVGVYSVWREASLVEGAFERGVKEVICACVSASVRGVWVVSTALRGGWWGRGGRAGVPGLAVGCGWPGLAEWCC